MLILTRTLTPHFIILILCDAGSVMFVTALSTNEQVRLAKLTKLSSWPIWPNCCRCSSKWMWRWKRCWPLATYAQDVESICKFVQEDQAIIVYNPYVGWIIHQPIRVSNTVPCDWPHSFVQFKTSETGLRHGPQQLRGIALITEWKRRLPSSKAKSAKSTRRTNDFNKSCCRMKGVLHQFRMKALRQRKCKLSKETFGCLL